MITSSKQKAANAVGGKTARACDGCLRRRARWYCTADDAFLCQACDSSVHSANQLAKRHERVRLETASNSKPISNGPDGSAMVENSAPTWHCGFTRKPRTTHHKPAVALMQPRSKEAAEKEKVGNSLFLVPEISGEDEPNSGYENEELLLYRVPIFDPFGAELCDVGHDQAEINYNGRVNERSGEFKERGDDVDYGFVPLDMELDEFAADVESLLGRGGLDEEELKEYSCGVEKLGFFECKGELGGGCMGSCLEGGKVLIKDEVDDEDVGALDMTRESIDWNFGYELLGIGEEEEKGDGGGGGGGEVETELVSSKGNGEVGRKMLLRLNYEAVINSWDSQGSPWTTGVRPELNLDDCWLDFTGSTNEWLGIGGQVRCDIIDEGREARVSRYREKRRTRLFSKKIRYEVRKLNAEKRPRMKGRFVKRSCIDLCSSSSSRAFFS